MKECEAVTAGRRCKEESSYKHFFMKGLTVVDSTSREDLSCYITSLWNAVSFFCIFILDTFHVTHPTWKMFKSLLKFLLTVSQLISSNCSLRFFSLNHHPMQV